MVSTDSERLRIAALTQQLDEARGSLSASRAAIENKLDFPGRVRTSIADHAVTALSIAAVAGLTIGRIVRLALTPAPRANPLGLRRHPRRGHDDSILTVAEKKSTWVSALLGSLFAVFLKVAAPYAAQFLTDRAKLYLGSDSRSGRP